MDTLLSQVHQFDGGIMICGDFNSRIGGLSDTISGVDNVPPRDIVDNKVNVYSNVFFDFLISSELCVLNGRNVITNDLTRIGSTGCSVVDYCIVPHDQLSMYEKFKVTRASDLFELSGCVGNIDPRCGISDHSILSWTVTTSIVG